MINNYLDKLYSNDESIFQFFFTHFSKVNEKLNFILTKDFLLSNKQCTIIDHRVNLVEMFKRKKYQFSQIQIIHFSISNCTISL